MQYVLYNTDTQSVIKTMNGPYMIDGQPAILPSGVVQLGVIQDAPPTVTGANYISGYKTVDLTTNTMRSSWAVVPMTDLTMVKNYKLNQLGLQYNQTVNSGITPSGASFTLAATDEDRNAFTQLATLLREYESSLPTGQQPAFWQSNITIIDISGAPINISVNDFRGALISYGSQFNELWGSYSVKKAQVAMATGISGVLAIN